MPRQVRDCLECYRPEWIFLSEPRVEKFELVEYLEAHYRPAPDSPDS